LVVILGTLAGLLTLTPGRASALPVGTITTVVGTGAPGWGPWPNPPLAGALNSPAGSVFDKAADAVFISDTVNCDVLQYSFVTNSVSVLVNGAHICGSPDPAGTPAFLAHLNHPYGLALNSGLNLLYIADRDNHAVQVVDLSTSLMQSFIPIFPGAGICNPMGVAVDQITNAIYVADQSCDVVWKVPFGLGGSIVAGIFNTPGPPVNAIPPTAATLNGPQGVDFVSGVLYIADTGNNQIRRVSGGLIWDEVGDPGGAPGCSPDGSTAFNPITAPSAVRLDGGGTLFFDEDGCDLVREVDASATLRTVAGTIPPGGISFPYSGNPATSVALKAPQGLAFVPVTAASADLWFSDTGNNVVDDVSGVASGAGFGSTPGVTSANSATAIVGQPFSFLVTTSGSPSPKIKAKGKLPKGLKFQKNADGTGTISGMPTSTKHKSAAGMYHVTFTATFGKGHAKVVAMQTWSLDVFTE